MTGVDALVIGGGFYGCHIALTLRDLGFARVRIVEKGPALMRRASYVNQARVHNGYHYPRSLPTGAGSRRNFRRFVEEHRFAVVPDVSMIYAIARTSRVTGAQFDRFCTEIGAPCREDPRALADLFDPALVETAFATEEIAFDTTRLAADLAQRLAAAKVECAFDTTARVRGSSETHVDVETSGGGRTEARYVFNCTYAALAGIGIRTANGIKKELAEIALIDPPHALHGRAVTVMDGPFFSSMPFPAENCYSLTHVRYTPHMAWTDERDDEAIPAPASRAGMMIRDAARFMPSMRDVNWRGSRYDLKAILVRAEENDGRPIVFERSPDTDRIYSILGAKIDNIYDVTAHLRREAPRLQ